MEIPHQIHQMPKRPSICTRISGSSAHFTTTKK